MKKLIYCFLFIIFTSCLPEQAPVQTSVDSSDSTSVSDDTDTADGSIDTVFTETTGWLNSGLVSTTLTVDRDNAKSVYLVGDQIHNYLSQDSDGDDVRENYSAKYCIEFSFVNSNISQPQRLRVKAIPAYSNSFSSTGTVRFLRVNLNSSDGNDFCQKSSLEIVNGITTLIDYRDSDQNSIIDSQDIGVVLDTSSVCPDCQGIINTSKVMLYKENSSSILEPLGTTDIFYNNLSFRIDMNSNADSGTNSCTDSECVNQGFNCCVQGQCVMEKSIKLSAVSANPQGFQSAEQEKYSNPNWFKKYPEFYYICLESQPTDVDPTDPNEPTDPVNDAQERLESLINDYHCIEELSSLSETDPFHTNPYNATKQSQYTKCNVTDETSDMWYESVMKRLYQTCGCEETQDLSKMVSTCHKYTYSPTYAYNSNGEQTTTITSISCVTPPQNQTPLPFQDLDLPVNSKSAPHRFFDTIGQEIIIGEDLPSGSDGKQEGVEFQYLDDYKIFPKNGDFNMNSIIGQITTGLDQARPAVLVNLEFDKKYIISTRSGMVSLCPTCAKDSWFSNFSATPSSTYGVGLQPVGSSTRRDTYGRTSSFGNYEDTIFGRACWLPPTMLPYSHSSNTDTQQQRLHRLETQAAMYVNGYQRDWFGFNKGALIGSFDGVTWFAIGKGRIVTSTTNKLYLAINAPFADLTIANEHIVSVQEYDFTATAAEYDYVPDLEINDPYQNEAASCQESHECEVDSHCITKLGWEYVCADVNYNKTKWPTFSADGALEVSNNEISGNIYEFLQQKRLPPGGTTKRCVYRGAGSPCRIDYDNITDEGLRKNMACAPNFYCAKLDKGNAFNKEVARFARPLDELVESKNHYFGQDANVIGRPKDYITTQSASSLPLEVQRAIEENVLITDSSSAGQIGLCRPGKQLPDYDTSTTTQNWNPASQHKDNDEKFRTDFISQISGCNSALYTDMRYSSCPMLDEEGNYIHLQDTFLNDIFIVEDIETPQTKEFAIERYSFAQNSCGLESLSESAIIGPGYFADDLEQYSAFKTIEAKPLSSSSVQFEPTLVRDACYRKAGAVCHTDLDCSPNRKMASVIDLVPASFFGNDAEKLYYQEYLVCGQAQKEPTISDDHYNTYSMHNNRCCRPIGEDLTMYTEDSPNADESIGLQTHSFGGLNPNQPERYSRYSVVDSQVDSTTLKSFITRPSANIEDSDNNKALDNTVNITNPYQWKTIHEAASKTCCGGSWVRKFADGTNNWSIKRTTIDPSDFSCLNYRSPLYLTENADAFGLSNGQLSSGKSKLCPDPGLSAGGCAQVEIGNINDFSILKPTLNETTSTMTLNTDYAKMDGEWINNLWSFNQFIPLDGVSGISEDRFILDWDQVKDSSDDDVLRENFITTLPMSIATSSVNSSPFDLDGDAINDIIIQVEDPQSEGDFLTCVEYTPPGNDYNCPSGRGGICGPKDSWSPGSCTDQTGVCSNAAFNGDYDGCVSSGSKYTYTNQPCCYMYNPTNRSLIVAHNQYTKDSETSFDKDTVSMQVTYIAPGTLAWEHKNALAQSDVSDQNYLSHRRSSQPGNALYYLKKLSKLEYLGIPQMTYEPVYCNDNYQKMVPGIFKEDVDGLALKTVSDFINHPRTFIDNNTDTPWNSDSASGTYSQYNADTMNMNLVGNQELIDHPQVFSDNKFKCCIELLGTTDNAANCCSGYAVDAQGNTSEASSESSFTCKLPSGTNLNVYFNKFVSGEGLSSELGVTPLDTEDFDSKTGEPITDISVINKLNEIGRVVCPFGTSSDDGVRRGGIFGEFVGEPVGNGQQSGTEESSRIFSIVDSLFDDGTSNADNVGRTQFNNGYIWNHHVYCE